jgi:predicted nucleic acid-binding protein
MMKFALDSNVVLYAEGLNDVFRRDVANRLVTSVGISNVLLPLQALGEAVNVLTKRLRLKKADAVAMLTPWLNGVATQDTTRAVFEDAMKLVAQHQFQVWDAIILAAAKAGGASVLFSEDMQDGFLWDDVLILNPFSSAPNPIVLELFANPLQ